MNDIVRYENQLNTVPLRNFTAVELNFLMTLCAKAKEKESELIQIDFNEIRKLTHYKKNATENFINDLMVTNNKLLSCNFKTANQGIIKQFTLFNVFAIDTNTKKLEIEINKEFLFLLNKQKENWFFTRFELEEFINLKSSYAKECYRRLKQFKHTGVWLINIDEFKRLLSVPDKYPMSDIDKRVLAPIKEELEDIFINIKIEKIKKGRKVEKLKFTFTPEKKFIKNDKIYEDIKVFGMFKNVHLYNKEISKLKKVMTKKEMDDYIERLSSYMESSGKSYKNHCATILRWYKEDEKEISKNKQNYSAKKTKFQNFSQTTLANLSKDEIKEILRRKNEKKNKQLASENTAI